MLQVLHIENVAVIQEAEITFAAGFNALTGETGAGKSIVIDAMGAVLGQRTSRELIRTGADHALVRALFVDVPPMEQWEECDVSAEEGELLLQREIFADGKTLCRINGKPVTVSQLKKVGSCLLNIHGQHDGQQLLDEEQHRSYLDSFGGTEPLLATYDAAYRTMEATRRQLKALRMDESEKERRLDTLRFQIEELKRAKLRNGEEEQLQQRKDLLRNSERFMSAIQGALWSLTGGDDGNGAVTEVREAKGALSGVRTLDDGLEQLYQRLEATYSELYDIAETLRDREGEMEFSPRELDSLENRLDQLYRLKKKYGPTVADMLAYLEQCQIEQERITVSADMVQQLEQQLAKQRRQVLELGEQLTRARQQAAERLERRILEELRQLDMPKVRFSIRFTEKEPDAAGLDEIRFLMSANAGEELRPIQKVASGGELARIMLALKNVLAENETIGTMVFDEIDTGISGRAAQRVAEKLAQVSRRKQVLCVTHLPQLACMADVHFVVEKEEQQGRTFTRVELLSRSSRREELARLTGGENPTQAMLDSAEELITAAEQYKTSLGETL